MHDRLFGPVLACGAGGTVAELLKDIAVRITPLSDLDAHDMVRSLKTFPLLDGYRGAPRVDVAALEDVMLRIGTLVEGQAEIAELDCNPVMVGQHGACRRRPSSPGNAAAEPTDRRTLSLGAQTLAGQPLACATGSRNAGTPSASFSSASARPSTKSLMVASPTRCAAPRSMGRFVPAPGT